jgi:hypothetical protein
MFGKGKSVGEDWRQRLQRSAIAPTAARLDSSKTISAIGSEMTIVGKLICKDLIKVYGLVGRASMRKARTHCCTPSPWAFSTRNGTVRRSEGNARESFSATSSSPHRILGPGGADRSARHMGGVAPSRPTRHARPCSVPSGCLAATMNTLAPTLRSLLSLRM